MTQTAPDEHAAEPDPPTTLQLLEEQARFTKRLVERDRVRVRVVTRERVEPLRITLEHERVEIDRVPVGRFVDAVPPVREDGDLTILPVVEETVVLERRLLLKEEVWIRRVRSTEEHTENVTLRSQDVVIERSSNDCELAEQSGVAPASPNEEKAHGR